MRFSRRLVLLYATFLPLVANAQVSTKGVQFTPVPSIPCPALTSCMWIDVAQKQVNFYDGTTAKTIPSVVATTKGDLAAYTGTVWAKLASGVDGQCLLAASSQTTGLQWGACSPGGTVTSIGMTVPTSIMSVTPATITTAGTFAVSLATQLANLVWAGPTSGGAATPTFRSLVAADLPSGTASGSGVSQEIATWSGTNSLTGATNFNYDGTNLLFGTVSANSAPTITAKQLTTSAINASTMTVSGGKGFDSSGGIAGAAGAVGTFSGGAGGAGSTGLAAGSGANAVLMGGTAGNINGGSAAPLSGSAVVDAGALNGATAAGTVSIGTTNASAISLGRGAITTTNVGPFTSSGVFTASATANLNSTVNLGSTSANTIAPNGTFSSTLLIAKNSQGISQAAAPADQSSLQCNVIAGAGGAASATAGGNGATMTLQAGAGGAGTASLVPGNGGTLTIASGAGGTGGTGNSNGGNVTLDAGAAHGTGTLGALTIGASGAGTVSIGRAGQIVNIVGGHVLNYLNTTSAGPTITVGQNIVGANRAGAVSATLPAQTAGLAIMIKDESGAAGTNNITVTPASGTIDGAANKVINTNYGILRVYSNGTNWFTW